MAAVSGAVAWTIPITENGVLDRIALIFSSAPSQAGDVSVTLDCVEGAAYDHELASDSPVGETNLILDIKALVSYGDQVVVEYANADERTITAIAYMEQ
jgi:hypothetical protein